MAELFAILFLVEIVLLITTIVLFLYSKNTIGGIAALMMLATLVLLFVVGCGIELENLIGSCECGCENCIGEMVGRR